PFQAKVQDLSDLPEKQIERIQHFFEHYKDLEKGKWVKVIASASALSPQPITFTHLPFSRSL
ncbi:MAG: inorganic diphosphatase, partial [Pseudomonadota bacterium]